MGLGLKLLEEKTKKANVMSNKPLYIITTSNIIVLCDADIKPPANSRRNPESSITLSLMLCICEHKVQELYLAIRSRPRTGITGNRTNTLICAFVNLSA